ncbi:MAG: metallophosphoesterase [Abditibacteriota bacterium]|nr:metallophosphoesterase [Abditibacteriota bacterium]
MKKLLFVLCLLLSAMSLMAYSFRPIETDWQFITDKNNEGIEKGYLKNDYDTSNWISMPCNVVWEKVIGDYDGFAWYKRVDTFTKEDLKNKYIYIKFKAVDEEATVYVNGKLAIEHTVEKTQIPPEELWVTPFMVNIKPYLKQGENQIKVKVFDKTSAGGIYSDVAYILTDESLDFDFKKSIDIVELNPNFEDYITVGLKSKGPIPPFSLFWFSDIHGAKTELQRLTSFYERYEEYFDDAICTGDNILSSSISSFSFWNEVPGAKKIMFTTGNHDTLKTHENNYDWNFQISQKEVYDLYFAPYIKNWKVIYEEGKTYYYKDYPKKSVRLICLDCMQIGDEQIAQCQWLKGVLKEAKDNKLSVIIATHMPFIYGNTTLVDSTFNNLDQELTPQYGYPCYKNIRIYQEAVDEFMKEGGVFVCYITGHFHSDHIFYNEEYPDQLQIIVDAAHRAQSENDNDMMRSFGRKSMDLANVLIVDTTTNTLKIIRVGADLDKYFRKRDVFSYDYKNKKVLK